jgi:hypothetical protein
MEAASWLEAPVADVEHERVTIAPGGQQPTDVGLRGEVVAGTPFRGVERLLYIDNDQCRSVSCRHDQFLRGLSGDPAGRAGIIGSRPRPVGSHATGTIEQRAVDRQAAVATTSTHPQIGPAPTAPASLQSRRHRPLREAQEWPGHATRAAGSVTAITMTLRARTFTERLRARVRREPD